MQKNSKCRLFGDRDEMVNHIISKSSKLEQKDYRIRHAWVGKVIYWKLCLKLKLDHTTKWYMHKPESVQENRMLKILWAFEIQIDHLILARRPNLDGEQ